MVVADAFPNFSICGIPYYVSGEVGHWRDLAHRTTADLEATGMRLRLDTRATGIDVSHDPSGRRLHLRGPAGRPEALPYDALVVGTGATPVAVRVTGATGGPEVGRLLGAQLVGRRGTEIAKRVDTYAAAIHHGTSVDEVSDLDLSYTPPLGSPWDAVRIAAQTWTRAHPDVPTHHTAAAAAAATA